MFDFPHNLHLLQFYVVGKFGMFGMSHYDLLEFEKTKKMKTPKRFGLEYLCPRCCASRFFGVNFSLPLEPDDKNSRQMILITVCCEHCGYSVLWKRTPEQWKIMREEFTKIK